ncbi:hypothetical protein [Oceaniglobus trochenteri]|uniref:putative barnase/colicin E5 family endoribonuclease n=1 Tax=Oceaniglobus trochenteri TaxID=2763260 RepID=UPI001CFFB450|nr:hypothetical protein [Oceaniglobus trochenteri]
MGSPQFADEKFTDLVVAEAALEAAENPDAWDDMPLDPKAFTARINSQRKADLAEAEAVLNQPGGAFAEFAGSMARAFVDPVNLALAPFGLGGSLGRVIVSEAALGAAGEAASLPREYRVADELDIDPPNPLVRIASGAVFGGGVAGVIGLGARALSHVSAKRQATREATADSDDPLGTRAEIDAAERRLAGRDRPAGRMASGRKVPVTYELDGKIRSIPPGDAFVAQVQSVVAPLGDDIGVVITSGGQVAKGTEGPRTGSTRHDVDEHGEAHTADIVLTRKGVRVRPADDPELYEKFFNRAAAVWPGLGHYEWGVHVGGGSVAAWGPDKTSRTLDPRFGRAIAAGRQGRTLDGAGSLGEVIPIEIRNGIFAGESGGDYDALFGFQNRTGGRYADVRLTDMTVDEAIAFASPRGEYAGWVRSQVGRTATPMGAYQIVGQTLREFKAKLRLTGEELMTPELQDRIAYHIWKDQGTGAWQGYRGPRSTAPSASGGASAAGGGGAVDYSGYSTSRGYTDTGQVRYGDGKQIDVEYVVADLSTLRQASGDLQPRDRGRASSDAQVAQIAAGLDPALLMPSPTADRGTPIVGPDDVIESGNGRMLALGRAYDQGLDRAQAYRQAIEAAGYEIPEGIERPVLIARRTSQMSDAERRTFVVEAQDSGVMRMPAEERARVGAGALDGGLMSKYRPDADLRSPDNAEFTRGFLSAYPASERADFTRGDKSLSSAAIRQIRDVFFARAYEAPDIVARYVEEDAGPMRSLMDALATAAPDLAALRIDIANGLVAPEMDITPFLLDAVRLIASARDLAAARPGSTAAQMVEELLADVDLLDGAIAPLTRALVARLMPGGRQAPADKVAAFLRQYAGEARAAGRTGGLLDAPGPLDVLKRIDPDTFGDLTETGISRAGASEMQAPDALPSGAADEGASSPDLVAGDQRASQAMRDEAQQPFGPIHTDLRDQPEAAIQRLLAEKTGEVPDAIVHPELGDIAFVYGKPDPKGFGLSHIIEDHPGDIERVIDVLRRGTVVQRSENRVRLVIDDGDMAVAAVRLSYDGKQKNWLLTGYRVDRPADVAENARLLRRTDVQNVDASTAPDATGPSKDKSEPATWQAPDPSDDVAQLRASSASDELTFTREDGTELSLTEMLDELDEDDVLTTVVSGCALKGSA